MIRKKLLTPLCFAAMAFAAEPAPPAGVPAGAVKTADGYRFTDAEGHPWVYRPTAFGTVRLSAAEAKATKQALAAPGLRATDRGDTVSFERPTPFGPMRWERKKSEMDATERAAWERQMRAAETDRK